MHSKTVIRNHESQPNERPNEEGSDHDDELHDTTRRKWTIAEKQ